jgi:inorganic pyrophosphatase
LKEKNDFLEKVMNTKEYLGKEVTVVMDRQMGSKHPKHGFIYPVNYGYIPNTVSGDGEELDAYVLGEFKPLETYTGVVKAIIHRTNDDDDKLVVMSKEKNYSAEQIRALTEFQERFFESEIVFANERCKE